MKKHILLLLALCGVQSHAGRLLTTTKSAAAKLADQRKQSDQNHQQEIDVLKRQHEETVATLKNQHEQELAKLKAEHEAEIAQQKKDLEQKNKNNETKAVIPEQTTAAVTDKPAQLSMEQQLEEASKKLKTPEEVAKKEKAEKEKAEKEKAEKEKAEKEKAEKEKAEKEKAEKEKAEKEKASLNQKERRTAMPPPPAPTNKQAYEEKRMRALKERQDAKNNSAQTVNISPQPDQASNEIGNTKSGASSPKAASNSTSNQDSPQPDQASNEIGNTKSGASSPKAASSSTSNQNSSQQGQAIVQQAPVKSMAEQLEEASKKLKPLDTEKLAAEKKAFEEAKAEAARKPGIPQPRNQLLAGLTNQMQNAQNKKRLQVIKDKEDEEDEESGAESD